MEDKIDTITMDVPLFLRMLEYAKEDAKSDMDLHFALENILKLNKETPVLSMTNYNDIINVPASEVQENNKIDIRKLVESKLFTEWFEPDIVITPDNYKDYGYNLKSILLPVMKHKDITYDPDAPEIEKEFKYINDEFEAGNIAKIEIKSIKNEHPYFYVYTTDGGVYDPGDIEILANENNKGEE